MSELWAGDFIDHSPTPYCGRLDTHDTHDTCPGAPLIEGGALDTHDCGARVHPDDIRDCCRRCETTICPNCAPCRRIT